MTRVAVVAESEDLRAALANALRASPAFDVVAAAATIGDVGGDAEVVVVAREPRGRSRVGSLVDHTSPGVPVLTPREQQILQWIYHGKSNIEIGMILGISSLTVKNHVQKILRRLNVQNRTQAVGRALSLRILAN